MNLKSLFGFARGFVRAVGELFAPIDVRWEAADDDPRPPERSKPGK